MRVSQSRLVLAQKGYAGGLGCLRIPGEREKDSGVNVKTIPG